MVTNSLGDNIRSSDNDALASLLEEVTREGELDLVHEDRVSQIEGYRLDRVIGTGGMGTVWRAEQISTKRVVALKIQKSPIESREDRARQFEQEIVLAASLTHAQIVRVYESGHRDGVRYFAMELVEGVPLEHYLADRGELSEIDSARLVLALCGPVSYAHGCGVIHQDLKPSNVLMGNDGLLRIADFGLAARFSDGDHDDRLTHGGGTPEFMAPEQMNSERAVSPATDVYGLGAILFFIVCGQPPLIFDREHDDPSVLMTKARRSIRDSLPGVSKELAAIVDQCLAIDPETRYASVAALAEDLRCYVEGRPVRAYKSDAVYRIVKTARRLRRQLVVWIVVLVVMVAGGLLAWQQSNESLRDMQKYQQIAHVLTVTNQLRFAQLAIKEGRFRNAEEALAKVDTRDRGWEWRYLKQLQDSSAFTFDAGVLRGFVVDAAMTRVEQVGAEPKSKPVYRVLTSMGEVVDVHGIDGRMRQASSDSSSDSSLDLSADSPLDSLTALPPHSSFSESATLAKGMSHDGQMIVRMRSDHVLEVHGFESGVESGVTSGTGILRTIDFSNGSTDREKADDSEIRISDAQLSSRGRYLGVRWTQASLAEEYVVADLKDASSSLGRYPVSGAFNSFCFSGDETVAYVSSDELWRIDLASGEVETWPGPVKFKRMAVSPSGRWLAGVSGLAFVLHDRGVTSVKGRRMPRD